ncbi:hypothetical protein BSZ21_15480 [Bradyrhizobium canariense]|nr:hypothetical protein BSZ21_15480 [Bradyrhizobium canariense]
MTVQPDATFASSLLGANSGANLERGHRRAGGDIDRFHGAVHNASSYCLLIARRSILQRTNSDKAGGCTQLASSGAKPGQLLTLPQHAPPAERRMHARGPLYVKIGGVCSASANVVANSPLHRSTTIAPARQLQRVHLFIFAGDCRDQFKA